MTMRVRIATKKFETQITVKLLPKGKDFRWLLAGAKTWKRILALSTIRRWCDLVHHSMNTFWIVHWALIVYVCIRIVILADRITLLGTISELERGTYPFKRPAVCQWCYVVPVRI
jgi:hypothetical protein